MLLAMLILIFFSLFSFGWACRDLSGDWVNEKGSNLTIHYADGHGTVDGFFTTAVESRPGASGGSQPIRGWSDAKNELISFAIMFNTSTVAFNGQCYTLKNGEELLWTTWILRSKAEACGDNWMANRVGEDRFTRIKKYVNIKKARTSRRKSRILKKDLSGPCG